MKWSNNRLQQPVRCAPPLMLSVMRRGDAYVL